MRFSLRAGHQYRNFSCRIGVDKALQEQHGDFGGLGRPGTGDDSFGHFNRPRGGAAAKFPQPPQVVMAAAEGIAGHSLPSKQTGLGDGKNPDTHRGDDAALAVDGFG